MEIEFGRLYFDTQPLRESQWPKVSMRLKSIFDLARFFGIRLCLPAPVLAERKAQWLTDHSKHLSNVKRALSKTRKHGEGVIELPDPPEVDHGQVVDSYDDRVGEVLKEFSIDVPKMTTRLADEFFDLALRTVPPFAEKGTGFKDAVILASILDHNEENQMDKRSAVVTKDGDFNEEALEEISTGLGVDIQIFRSLEEVEAIFIAALEDLQNIAWKNDRAQAEIAFLERIEALESYICETIQFQEYDLGRPLGRILEISELKVVKIRDVQTPLPWQRPMGEKVEIGCLAEVRLRILFEGTQLPPTRSLRVGEGEQSVSQLAGLLALGSGLVRQQMDVTKVIEVECRALPDQGKFRDLEFVRARRREDLFSHWDLEMMMVGGSPSVQGDSEADDDDASDRSE